MKELKMTMREGAPPLCITHGHTRGAKHTRAYASWRSLLGRCFNPRNNHYHRYGGRGINVCERWRNSFEDFLADMGEPAKGMTLDRINNNGNYEPSNCRWATAKQQGNNSAKNNMVTYRGKTQSIAQWGEEVGIKANTLLYRLRRGWTLDRAFLQSVQERRL